MSFFRAHQDWCPLRLRHIAESIHLWLAHQQKQCPGDSTTSQLDPKLIHSLRSNEDQDARTRCSGSNMIQPAWCMIIYTYICVYIQRKRERESCIYLAPCQVEETVNDKNEATAPQKGFTVQHSAWSKSEVLLVFTWKKMMQKISWSFQVEIEEPESSFWWSIMFGFHANNILPCEKQQVVSGKCIERKQPPAVLSFLLHPSAQLCRYWGKLSNAGISWSNTIFQWHKSNVVLMPTNA